MAGQTGITFQDAPSMILRNASDKDLVAICVQECPRKVKSKRASELEVHMNAMGYHAISAELLDMWEMFLLVFIKRELVAETANVSAMKLAKGAMKGMIGNKGAIAYNFTLKNRHFNVIATHLRHGQNAVAERDQMASELVSELRL